MPEAFTRQHPEWKSWTMAIGADFDLAAITRAADANYRPRTRAASHGMAAEEVDAIYPRPGPELMYRQSMSFVDPDPEFGQTFPGFPLAAPRLDIITEEETCVRFH